MRKHLKFTFLICTIALFVGSCSSDDGSIFDTPIPDNTGGEEEDDSEEPEVATIVFNEAVPSSNITTASASGEAGTNVTGRVIFTSDATTQRRMYITQNYLGQGEMPFSSFDLVSPAQDGTTESFFSLLNETVYRINVGPEFRAFWDFGYYYGASGDSAGDNASFASTEQYDASFGFAVEGLEPGADEENAATETLNQMFFASSTTIDAAAFDAITLNGELNFIASSDAQKITNLSVGDVVEFVDNYGKKGLIKITAIEPGFNNNDFIEFDVKIQP